MYVHMAYVTGLIEYGIYSKTKCVKLVIKQYSEIPEYSYDKRYPSNIAINLCCYMYFNKGIDISSSHQRVHL